MFSIKVFQSKLGRGDECIILKSVSSVVKNKIKTTDWKQRNIRSLDLKLFSDCLQLFAL